MKKKLKFQKKIIGNLQPDKMKRINGGKNASGSIVCYPEPEPTSLEDTCTLQSQNQLCQTNLICPSIVACPSVGCPTVTI